MAAHPLPAEASIPIETLERAGVAVFCRRRLPEPPAPLTFHSRWKSASDPMATGMQPEYMMGPFMPGGLPKEHCGEAAAAWDWGPDSVALGGAEITAKVLTAGALLGALPGASTEPAGATAPDDDPLQVPAPVTLIIQPSF